jgi:hypothetical protein
MSNRQILICPNQSCSRPFQVNLYDVSLTLGIPAGKIRCPHCGLTLIAESAYAYLTHALSVEEEAAWLKREHSDAKTVERGSAD